MSSSLPTEQGKKALEANRSILSAEESTTVDLLLANDQAHLFAHWPPAGTEDSDKHRFLKQCQELEKAYVGGISTYVKRAKQLLAAAEAGENAYEGFKVQEPTDSARVNTPEDFAKYEELGVSQAVPYTGFVIVAGGLGERLGYKGIKLALPSEIVTETSFIELYCKFILALQDRARTITGNANLVLPLGIMTSDDTDKLTRALLTAHSNFGLTSNQLTIFKQGKVPSMVDKDAHFTLEESDKYALDTKPHGHGDVHMLLYQEHIIQKWVETMKIKHIVFFQDTNGIVFRAIIAGLGVSVEKKLQVNSLTVPRVQGDAVGAICKLVREPDANRKQTSETLPDTLTLSVEYNQLEGLMGKGKKEPLVPGTNYSVYPGNINVLIFDATPYLQVLEKKKGTISEFVNPKYNADKKSFKKPTRLECMMQDWAKLLDKDAIVGFTEFHRWTSFSAVKNALADGAQKQKDGNAPEAAATGEAEYYLWFHKILKDAGVDVAEPDSVNFRGITVKLPPKIVLFPSVGVTQKEIQSKFPGKNNVHISLHSTLIVEGDGVVFQNAKIDGTLIIHAAKGANVNVNGLTVHNRGWFLQEIKDESGIDQKYTVRGYTLVKHEQETYEFTSAGNYVLSDETKSQYKSGGISGLIQGGIQGIQEGIQGMVDGVKNLLS